MFRISTATAAPGGAAAFHPSFFPVGANADRWARACLADSVLLGHRRPGIDLQLLQPKRDLSAVAVYTQDLDRDRVARPDHVQRIPHPRPVHLRHVQEALDSTAEVHERPVRHHRHDAAGQDRSGDDGPADRLGLLALLLLQEDAPGDDQLLAVLFAFDDPERVGLPYVDRRVGGETGVDLRDRTEGALPADSNFVTPLDRFLDTTLHRESGPERLIQALPRDGPPGELVGELQAADRRDDDGLDGVPDLHLDVALRICQLLEVDRRLALAADVDERDLVSERHDGPHDRFPLPVEFRRGCFLQHPCKILLFLGIGSRAVGHLKTSSDCVHLISLPPGGARSVGVGQERQDAVEPAKGQERLFEGHLRRTVERQRRERCSGILNKRTGSSWPFARRSASTSPCRRCRSGTHSVNLTRLDAPEHPLQLGKHAHEELDLVAACDENDQGYGERRRTCLRPGPAGRHFPWKPSPFPGRCGLHAR